MQLILGWTRLHIRIISWKNKNLVYENSYAFEYVFVSDVEIIKAKWAGTQSVVEGVDGLKGGYIETMNEWMGGWMNRWVSTREFYDWLSSGKLNGDIASESSENEMCMWIGITHLPPWYDWLEWLEVAGHPANQIQK